MHNSSKPIIGVTGPDKGGGAGWLFLRIAIYMTGGKAVRITPLRDIPDMESLDGLVIGGGADIHPQRYGQELNRQMEGSTKQESIVQKVLSYIIAPIVWLPRKILAYLSSHGEIDLARDNMEFSLLEEAERRNMPVLGVCRGAQLMNVYLGGSLHQEIHRFYGEVPNYNSILPKKEVEIENESRLYSIIQRDSLKVNAMNLQAIDETGENVRVAARERNGLIQAIEHKKQNFWMGLQWHPEYMPQKSEERRIIGEFVKAAENHKSTSE